MASGTELSQDAPAAGPDRVVGVGIDLVDPERLRAALLRQPRLAERLFTPAERLRFQPHDLVGPARSFAAKEAVMKAIGRGIGVVAFTDIEVDVTPEPRVVLSATADGRAGELGISWWEVEFSFHDPVQCATVFAYANDVVPVVPHESQVLGPGASEP